MFKDIDFSYYFEVEVRGVPKLDGPFSPMLGLECPLPPDRRVCSPLSSLMRGLYAFPEKLGL